VLCFFLSSRRSLQFLPSYWICFFGFAFLEAPKKQTRQIREPECPPSFPSALPLPPSHLFRPPRPHSGAFPSGPAIGPSRGRRPKQRVNTPPAPRPPQLNGNPLLRIREKHNPCALLLDLFFWQLQKSKKNWCPYIGFVFSKATKKKKHNPYAKHKHNPCALVLDLLFWRPKKRKQPL